MKKLMTAVLGLSLLTGLATVSFARQEDKKEDTKKAKKTKKSKKAKKEETKKEG
jgi:hypothetical protein